MPQQKVLQKEQHMDGLKEGSKDGEQEQMLVSLLVFK